MREAGFGRTIFYRHFDDLADLLLRGQPRGDRGALRGPAQLGQARADEDPDAVRRALEAAVDVYQPPRPAAARRGSRPPPGDEQIARDYAALRKRFDDFAERVAARAWPTSARPRLPTWPRPRGR